MKFEIRVGSTLSPKTMSRSGFLLPLGDFAAHDWNQFTTVVDRILERVESPDQESRHAKVVVGDQGLRYLLRSSH